MRKLRIVDFRKTVKKGETLYYINEEILPVAKKLYPCSGIEIGWTVDKLTLMIFIAEHNKYVYTHQDMC